MPNLLKLASAAFGSGFTSLSLFKKQSHARMDCENRLIFNPRYPENTSWYANWDGFHDVYCESEIKPKGVKNILFVKTAQHELFGPNKGLTELGKKQAEGLGKFLVELGKQFPIEQTDVKVVSSSEQYTQETAMIAMNTAQYNLQGKEDSRLNHGIPLKPSPVTYYVPTFTDVDFIARAKHEKETKEKTDEKRKQLDEFFAETFSRSTTDQNTFELYFCDKNIIHFLTMKLLQLPLNAWSRFRSLNCSITWFQIKPNGRVSCVTFGNNGFLSQELWTEDI